MKIPVFEEIVLADFNFEQLKHTILNSRAGTVPCYISLLAVNKSDLNGLVLELENIFSELKLHCSFPYPTYLICADQVDSIFPIISSSKELPDHFFKRVKRPSNKELQLLNKLGLKVDKLNNLDRTKILQQFEDTSHAQRNLYNLTKELYFLEILHAHIHPKEKSKK
jgi:hypothetical protein